MNYIYICPNCYFWFSQAQYNSRSKVDGANKDCPQCGEYLKRVVEPADDEDIDVDTLLKREA